MTTVPRNNRPPGESAIKTIDPREARRVVRSSAIGTTIEFYDFSLYGLAAALVFGPQFFSSENPATAQLAALATFSIGFFFRPIGGVIAGHFGDRIGRKTVMLWSFIIMGTATLLVGFLPTYGSIGVVAPLLLVTLRAVQGLAAGAEWSGAALMAVEHAPANKRGLYGSAPAFGTSLGPLLASTVFLVVSLVNKEAFVNFGWRIAFGLSFLLVVYGFYLRRRVTESPLFEEALKHEPPRVPLAVVLKRHRVAVLRTMSWVLVSGAPGYIVNTYAVTLAVKNTGGSQAPVLAVLNVAFVLGIIALLITGRLYDRHRRKVLITAALFQIPASILLFPLLSVGTLPAAGLAFALVWIGIGIIECTRGALISDLFPVEVRYTGMALSYNLAYVLAGLAPLAAAAIVTSTGSITWMVVILAVISLMALPTAFVKPRVEPIKLVENTTPAQEGAESSHPGQAPVK